METIQDLAAAASKAVWGTDGSKAEPVSGKTGDVSKGEPYDAGNMEPREGTGVTGVTGSEAIKPSELPMRTKTTNTDATTTLESTPKESTEDTPATTTSTDSGPHETKDSSISSADMSRAQQDVRPPSDEQTRPSHARARSNVDDSSEGVDKGDNPAKIDGPGPKPIAEVAKAHGGDAGRASEDAHEGGDDEEDGGNGVQKKSHGSGTGEQYVKSTGLAADGGNFDASQPGAGREADRLLEEKGVHRQPGAPNPAPSDTDDSKHANGHGHGHTKEKKSLGEKIKAKLHKNTTTT